MKNYVTYKVVASDQERSIRGLLKSTVRAICNPNYLENPAEKQRIEECVSFYSEYGFPLPELHDVYIGAYIETKLVGALHATSYLSQFRMDKLQSEMNRLRISGKYSEEQLKIIAGTWVKEHCTLVENGLFIEEIGVLPEYRGTGVGRGLLSALEQTVMNPQGISRLVLVATSEESHTFFDHMGYRNYGDLLPAEYCGGVEPLKLNRGSLSDDVEKANWFAKKNDILEVEPNDENQKTLNNKNPRKPKGWFTSLVSRVFGA